MNAFRERDIRIAIRDALLATGYFDACYLNPAESESSEDASACEIEPLAGSAESEWDAQTGGLYFVDSQVRLTLLARHDDPQLRDERAERLLMAATNALRGHGFDGKTLPAWSVVNGWSWFDPEPPERAIEATFSFRYFVDSWQGLNTTE